MSLRDFNAPASDDPIALHTEPSGNGSGLSSFHTVSPEEREPNNVPKIIGVVAVALMVGAAAVGLYAYSGHSTKPVVADNSLPQTPPVTPPQQTAMAQDNSISSPAPVPSAVPPAPSPTPAATTEMPKSAPVRTASIRSARSHISSMSNEAAPITPVPQQAQATPLPPAPSPSPSDVASNNSQFSAAVPNNAVTAPEVPQASAAPQQLQSSTPQASNAAPAQDQQSGATPPPAQ